MQGFPSRVPAYLCAMLSDDHLLAGLRAEIETQLGWGPADQWTNSDFQTLSDRIAEATEVALSPTTLKRVWGRVAYTSRPSTTTLDALAVFGGYDHWRAFRAGALDASRKVKPVAPGPVLETVTQEPSRSRLRYLLPLGIAVVGALALLFYSFFAPAAAPEKAVIDPADYHLSFRPVTTGVPNSVVFNYHAEKAPTEEVYLQQSWDARRRERLDRGRNTHTSIYYLPGYYRAKLVVDEQVVREKELYLRSADWVAAVDLEPVPVYLPPAEVRRDGRLSVTAEQLTDLGLSLQPDPPTTVMTHVGAIKDLWTNDFTFSTRLRHDYAIGAAACRHARVYLLLKNGAIIIPLSAAGCVAELELYAGGRTLSGRDTDLSAFGVVGDTWLDLSCTGENGLLTFSVNGRQVFQLESGEEAKEIIGVRYEFAGVGAVEGVRFSDGGGVVWGDLVLEEPDK